MTTTPSSADVCGICLLSKVDHEGLNHMFNVEGDLVPTPTSKRASKSGDLPATSLVLSRLITILTAKGVLTPTEVQALFVEVIIDG